MKQEKDLEQLISVLLNCGWVVSGRQQEQLYGYLELLRRYAERQNLVSFKDQAFLIKKHFVDSCVFCSAILRLKKETNKNLRILDLGSGAGFPGVIIAILLGVGLVLLDSNRKKTLFLKNVSRKLGLNVDVVNERAKVYSKGLSAGFDIVTARAVTNLSVLVDLVSPLLSDNGYLVTLKGDDFTSEIKEPFDISMFVGLEPDRCFLPFFEHLAEKKIILYRKNK